MTPYPSSVSLTADLPLSVREALASHWLMGIALEETLRQEEADPDSDAHQTLVWMQARNLITEDMADLGLDALLTLQEDAGTLLIQRIADRTLVCAVWLMDTALPATT